MSIRLVLEAGKGKVTQVLEVHRTFIFFFDNQLTRGSWELFPVEWRAERIIIMSQPQFITQ